MGLFRTNQSFMQNLAWQNQAINALQYNTSQPGSAIPLIFGTVRQQVNLVGLGDYIGPGGGKKGKGVGPLPLGGTNTIGGKGGGGGSGKKGGKKAPPDYSVDVMFGMCEGPVTNSEGNNLVFASASVAQFDQVGLNFFGGNDGQSGSPVFNALGQVVNYSGTCMVSGQPLDLGSSPVIPNISCELNGFDYQTGGPDFPVDANPGAAITTFLTDLEVGCGFPGANLDNLMPDGSGTYGDYCQAALLLISVSLDAQQKAAEWLQGLAKLTNSAIAWSGELLRIIPYGDVALSANGMTWAPNLTPVFAFTDDDFLPWHPHEEESGPDPGQDDPILVTRTNPADAINWLSIEYRDRSNYYDPNIIAVYDQGAIDQFGRRTGDNLSGKAFCNATSAQISAQLYLQRSQYVRNTYKFQVSGWKYALLDLMDIVLLTGRAGDSYLQQQPVRVTSLEENDNGDLTVDAEEIQVGRPPPTPVPPRGFYWEITVNQKNGAFYTHPGELQLGLCNGTFNTWDAGYVAIPSPGDLGTIVYGLAAGQDANSFGYYQATIFGGGWNAFGNWRFGGFGPGIAAGHTYAFALDTVAGCLFARDVTGNSGWGGDPDNHNLAQAAAGLAGPNGAGVDMTPFGAGPVYICMTGCYWKGNTLAGETAGPNQVTLNTGSLPFAGQVPAAFRAWNDTTSLVPPPGSGPAVTIKGTSVTWSDSSRPNKLIGIVSSSGKTLQVN